MNATAPRGAPLPDGDSAPAPWRASGVALLFGNFAIGCGVMVTAGTLNDLVRSMRIDVALAGQLITVAAVVLALGSPLMAALVSGFDRRRLLALALAWFALGHALSALMPDFGSLAVMRALTMLGAAVFTPQAAAAIGVMVPLPQRGRAIAFVFLGWSVSAVLGMPLAAWIGEVHGWRWSFAGVALLAALAALGVWRALPDGVRPEALTRAHWARVFTHPALMAVVGVTALSAAGQFTLFSYFTPYYSQVLGASAGQISALLLWFGAIGVLGNVLVAQHIDRIGAPRAVVAMLGCMALSLATWPLGTSVALVALLLVPWALGCFASNSAQQVRLSLAAPALTPALIALNSSAMYVGQALGASSGGAMLAGAGFGALSWVALAWMCTAIGLSLWAQRRMAAAQTHA